MLKIVVDANVFISALLNPGNARQIVERFEREEFQLFYPPRLIRELQKVEKRQHLSSRIKSGRLAELIELIGKRATKVSTEPVRRISRDPTDDEYLACAALTHCDYLITGDNDLLCLESHENTKILRPADFLTIIKE
jgi:putative PIN family toxin of toxin-antitoxin system